MSRGRSGGRGNCGWKVVSSRVAVVLLEEGVGWVPAPLELVEVDTTITTTRVTIRPDAPVLVATAPTVTIQSNPIQSNPSLHAPPPWTRHHQHHHVPNPAPLDSTRLDSTRPIPEFIVHAPSPIPKYRPAWGWLIPRLVPKGRLPCLNSVVGLGGSNRGWMTMDSDGITTGLSFLS
jgi:hypothetical protein